MFDPHGKLFHEAVEKVCGLGTRPLALADIAILAVDLVGLAADPIPDLRLLLDEDDVNACLDLADRFEHASTKSPDCRALAAGAAPIMVDDIAAGLLVGRVAIRRIAGRNAVIDAGAACGDDGAR